LYANENKVEVNFEVQITNNKTGSHEIIKETHSMRYFFLPELEFLMSQSGFELVDCFEWLTFDIPTFDSWYGVVVCRKK
jgi:hypothetical protein